MRLGNKRCLRKPRSPNGTPRLVTPSIRGMRYNPLRALIGRGLSAIARHAFVFLGRKRPQEVDYYLFMASGNWSNSIVIFRAQLMGKSKSPPILLHRYFWNLDNTLIPCSRSHLKSSLIRIFTILGLYSSG